MTKVEISLDEIQIYCGTYRKYNNGCLYGKWLKLSDYADFNELQDAMRQLHQDEKDPEFMFQDFEAPAFIGQLRLISESFLSPEIYNVIEKIENSDYSLEVWEAYFDCFGYSADLDIEEVSKNINENYQGEFSCDEDFAEELLTECGTLPNGLPPYIYIDWERTARDLMFDYSESNHHYFRN